MADLFHWFGNDLSVAANGDLLTVEGTVKGQQFVVRRLMTRALSYIWEVTYGAGLGKYVGRATASTEIEGVIRSQLYQEVAVAQNPVPQIAITSIAGGFNVVIQYVDGQTGAPSNLNFNVNE
jgi:hypothetical protein